MKSAYLHLEIQKPLHAPFQFGGGNVVAQPPILIHTNRRW